MSMDGSGAAVPRGAAGRDPGRWIAALSGGVMALYGISRVSLNGIGLAVLGSGPAYGSATGRGRRLRGLGARVAQPAGKLVARLPGKRRVMVRHRVAINSSPETLYRYWRDFTNLPRFMDHLVSVQPGEGNRWHWVDKAPGGGTVEWDAEIVKEEPNELIAWRSLPGADVANSGIVRFKPLPAGRGTEVHVTLEYDAPGGQLGAALAKLTGEEPQQQVTEDLRHFKQIMEAGEIPTTRGQSAGRRDVGLHKVAEPLVRDAGPGVDMPASHGGSSGSPDGSATADAQAATAPRDVAREAQR